MSNRRPVKACVFDAYGTLFDVHAPAAALAAELGAPAPAFRHNGGRSSSNTHGFEALWADTPTFLR